MAIGDTQQYDIQKVNINIDLNLPQLGNKTPYYGYIPNQLNVYSKKYNRENPYIPTTIPFEEIPKGTKKLEFYNYSKPEGCSCQGCCSINGWETPQNWLKVYAIIESKPITICDVIYSKENENLIESKYGLTIKNNIRYFVKYFDELKRAMTWLGEQEKTYFMGQAVCYKGTAMYNTLTDVPENKRRELPVFEETQMGMTIGLALQGYIPVSIFPRWNFLILATNQLVNHLDKYPLLGYPLGCIIRTAEGSERPLDPQHQHKGQFSDAYRKMLKNVKVVDLYEPQDIFPAYQSAYADALLGKSTILSEIADFYHEK